MNAEERAMLRILSSGGKVVTKQELEDLMRTESEELVGRLATEIWRLGRRLARFGDRDDLRPFADSADRLRDALRQFDVDVQEHAGENYHDGLQLEVLAGLETGVSLVIDETVEPTIRWKGRVIRRGRVTLKRAMNE